MTEQDKRIASRIADDLKAVVITASKADLIEVPGLTTPAQTWAERAISRAAGPRWRSPAR